MVPNEDDEEDTEESWTFVGAGDDLDAEIPMRLSVADLGGLDESLRPDRAKGKGKGKALGSRTVGFGPESKVSS